MTYHAIGALMLGLVACTAANPNYVGQGGGGPDGAVPVDGAQPDLGRGGGSTDLAPVCQDGQRACLTVSASASCVSGQYTLDRKCPTGSKCVIGYCGAPPQVPGSVVGLPCDAAPGPQENQCIVNTAGGDQLSCEPFVDPQSKSIRWACARPIGAGLPGAPCTAGSDCRSGFCGDNGTCFRACQIDTDCPLEPTGKRLSCHTVKITVEGVPVSQGSCVP